jgi:cytochrome oxidase assembly protein ShyY1
MANKSETKAQQQVVQEPSMAQQEKSRELKEQLEWQQYRALQVECRAREEQSRLLHQPPKAPQENAAQKKNVQYLKLGRELAPELYDEYYQ